MHGIRRFRTDLYNRLRRFLFLMLVALLLHQHYFAKWQQQHRRTGRQKRHTAIGNKQKVASETR